MNLQEGIEKLKELLFKAEAPKVELKFESAKLNDGTTQIEWEGDLAVGTIVYVLDSNGAKLPLPAGQYQLEDGTTFEIVDDMGTADKVVKAGEAPAEGAAPVAPAEVEQAAAPTAPAAAPKRVIKSQVEEHVFSLEIEGYEPISVDFSSMFTKLETENKELKAELEKEKSLNKEMFEVVKQIADEPAKVATEKIKTSPKEARKEIHEAFKKLTK